jgi:hypothetical protein
MQREDEIEMAERKLAVCEPRNIVTHDSIVVGVEMVSCAHVCIHMWIVIGKLVQIISSEVKASSNHDTLQYKPSCKEPGYVHFGIGSATYVSIASTYIYSVLSVVFRLMSQDPIK